LTTELTMRKQQYEYYRDSLLTFGEDVTIFKLKEVAQYSKDRINAVEVDKANYVGVDNLLQNRQGKTNSNYVPTEGRLTRYEKNNVLIGNIRPYLKKIWFSNVYGGTNGDVLVIQPIVKNLLPKYLYTLLCADKFFDFNMQNAKGAKMPRGNKEAIMNYSIPIPPLEEQQRIVDILDRFDTLVNDIKEGLPAEIEARKQQYEYYRDKLLTFKKLDK
ncbi:MAG: restriction endonuclease subunit S, partial [Cetobacterium sp.]